MSADPQKTPFDPNHFAAQVRGLALKIGVALGGLVLARDLWRLLVYPGRWIPWILDRRFPELAARIRLPWGLHEIAVLRAPIEWLKGIWLFLAFPIVGALVVVLLYWVWNYLLVPAFHVVLRFLSLVFRVKRPRHIIVCVDGTWNYTGRPSNVYEFWCNLQGERHRGLELASGATKVKRLDHGEDGVRQIGLYYEGVGNAASNSKLGYMFGGAFGFGAENLKEEAYRDIVRLVRSKNDKITIIGFSRGAAVARLVAAYIGAQGVPHLTLSDTTIGKLVTNTARGLFPRWSWIQKREVRVEFLGIWDTVASFGIPKDILGIPFQSINMLKDLKVPACVRHVVHLVALDEQRDSFVPTLLELPEPLPEGATPDPAVARTESAEEVWFPGVHTNVGGGPPDDKLHFIALEYMCKKFTAHFAGDVHVKTEEFGALEENMKSPLGHKKSAMYDMRPRRLPDDAKLHRSVVERMKSTELMDGQYCPPNVLDLIERLEEKKQRALKALHHFYNEDEMSAARAKIERDCKVQVVP